ncbi:winged helix DNA-binding domain-containing protein [Puniceicoccaceae bacterium K14]|nr:winged helix DNA-binding domain-containing protein [Puniceicoccaceae bacterium K14]
MTTLEQFRGQIINNSFGEPCELSEVIDQLGFLQADPIRSPARAQDLILRHRVKDYQTGDLEKQYPSLGIEECFLYAYGFGSKDLWQLIHPSDGKPLARKEEIALKLVSQHGPIHPKDLEALMGSERVKNYWGGYSRSAKMTLESLHDRGAIRVSHRNKGIRLYQTAETNSNSLGSKERFKEILIISLKSIGATTRKFLLSELRYFKYLVGSREERQKCLQELIEAGRIRTDLIDSIEYISLDGSKLKQRPLKSVRILAPFDPIVRDRTRFEHLWNWTYRFEAYTPKAKRKLGYYAMPLLWRDQVIGWANANVEDQRLKVEFGYASKKPTTKDYRTASEKEVTRLACFLKLKKDSWEISKA